MQSVSPTFAKRTAASMRPISFKTTASFTRDFDPSVDFFTVGVSSIGGPDIIKGTDDVLQDWDRYLYDDYSIRLLSCEWTRTEDPISSVTSAIADLTFDNHDGFFSADDFAFPYRPFKIYAGFGGENLPQLVGVSDAAPTLDNSSMTMSVHVIDFMSTLYARDLETDVILQNVRTDQALDAILQSAGLSPTQYVLDTAFNTIPFVYFPAGGTFGAACDSLMEAEQGTLFMDENGVITFLNRQDYDDTIVATFTKANTVAADTKTDQGIINVVTVESNVLEVQGNKQIYTLTGTTTLVPAGGTLQLWPNFQNPVVSVDTPVDINSATTSSYVINTEPDGSGSDAAITLTSFELFSTSYQMNFTNPNAYDIYIVNLTLFGEDAEVTAQISVRQQDDTSVAAYDEQVHDIANDYVQTQADAISLAQKILNDYSKYGNTRQITVKGSPAYQIRDAIQLAIDRTTYVATPSDSWASIASMYGITQTALKALNPTISTISDGVLLYLGIIPQDFKIKTIDNTISPGQFQQILTVNNFTPVNYFTVGVSYVGGPDVIPL